MENLVGRGGASGEGGLRREGGSCMPAPLDWSGGEDEVCAGQVRGAGDDLGGMPAVLPHDAGGEAGVLDGVAGVGFEDEIGSRDAIRLGDAGHGAGLVKAVDDAASEDEAWGYAALVFVDGLSDAGQGDGGEIAVAIDAGAEDDDGVEVVGGGVAGGS